MVSAIMRTTRLSQIEVASVLGTRVFPWAFCALVNLPTIPHDGAVCASFAKISHLQLLLLENTREQNPQSSAVQASTPPVACIRAFFSASIPPNHISVSEAILLQLTCHVHSTLRKLFA